MMAWGGRAWGEPGADPEGFKTSAMMAPTKATQSLSRPWWTGVVPRASSQPQDQYHGSNTFVAQGAAPPACAFGGKAGAGLWANGTVVSYERLSRDDRVQLSLLSLKLRLALFPEVSRACATNKYIRFTTIYLLVSCTSTGTSVVALLFCLYHEFQFYDSFPVLLTKDAMVCRYHAAVTK